VIVEWEDATSDRDFEGKPDAAGELETCFSAGFLIKDTPEMLVIAFERDLEGEEIRWTLSIPRGMVKNIYKIDWKVPTDAR
jgi:hypothetical protein